jgi:hypothetical protein
MADTVPGPHPATTRLSRADMERAIREGGSVLHEGQVFETVESLPTDAQLAAGHAERSEAVVDAIDRQMAALTAQRAQAQRQAEEARRLKEEESRKAAGKAEAPPKNEAPKEPVPEPAAQAPAEPWPEAGASPEEADDGGGRRKGRR